ncbi:hypothetical protein OB955_16380 [Halobacteria archaeon AArc-m2/3/4]|uniref:Small CPxCG-related zinc finger protein n=1 Tax=Natronoglomus mannanivorans TaxID=2979990 RepID=A0ABT2QHB1_9EURY|nr:hypothetical protein [Halobacteria archaeon AArc-m2/3/4]
MSDSDRDRSSDPTASSNSNPDSADPRSPTNTTLPLCPRCDHPVVAVTTRGPHDHVASPCGCRLSSGTLDRSSNG